jgi:hypothetical protein
MSGSIPEQLGRFLILAGIFLLVLGLIFVAGSRFSLFGLGRLPGDVAYKGKNFQIYFPIVTCLIVSGVLTAVLWIISFLARK